MSFCTGCGKSLQDGARFCTSCGIRIPAAASPTTAPVNAGSSSPAAATAPAMEQSARDVPAIAPPSQTPIAPSSGVSPFVVVICIILILLIGAAVSATLYLHTQSAPKVAAEKAARTTPQAEPEDDSIRALHLESYPAATPVAIVTLNGEAVIAGFVTKDRPEQVVQFYKVRFPISDVSSDEAGAHLSATLPGTQRIRIDAEPQGDGTEVKIVRLP